MEQGKHSPNRESVSPATPLQSPQRPSSGLVSSTPSSPSAPPTHQQPVLSISQVLHGSWVMIAVFLTIAIIEGVSFLNSTAPLTMPDPGMHLSSTYALATGQSFNITRAPKSNVLYNPDDTSDTGGMPDDGQQLLTGESRYLLENVNGAKNALVESINPFGLTKDEDYAAQCDRLDNAPEASRVVTEPTRSNQYMFFAYIPQAVGMRFGFLTHARPSQCILYARIMNLVCYLLLFLLAIAAIPTAKGLIALLGTFPLPLFCASTLMTDGTLYAAVALFVAVCVRLIQSERRINNWQVVALTAGACMVCILKYVYLPIIVLPWLASKALTVKQKFWYTGSTVLIVGAAVLCWQKFFGYNPEHAAGLYNYNFNAALHNPFGTLFRVVANVFVTTFNYVQGNLTLVTCLVAMLFAYMLGQRSCIVVSHRKTVQVYASVGLIVFGILFLMYLALLLTWTLPTEATGNQIDGVQMRYFYPILPLLVVPFIYRYQTERATSLC
ncbi:MAG: DUF2142 domain-containing protein [Bifidobacterium animalis]|nr:DUF2142 domain-containing protein [Bifidobacterium animalis]